MKTCFLDTHLINQRPLSASATPDAATASNEDRFVISGETNTSSGSQSSFRREEELFEKQSSSAVLQT